MTHWIDDSPYPWQLPVARDLHRRLVDTFFEPPEIRDVIRRAGAPDANRIAFTGTGAYQIWVATLDRAAAEGGLRVVMAYIADQVTVPKPLVAFLRDLLAERDPMPSAVVGGAAGPEVGDASKEEALLFGDDLSESVGEIPDLLAAIERVMKWRSAVCQLKVTNRNGKDWAGTGTLLTDGRVLTNHHVLMPGDQPAAAVAVEFNFEEDVRGQKIGSTIVAGDVTTIRSSKPDDWGVISIGAIPPGIVPLDLKASTGTAQLTERAFILQHPRGNPKRLAFVRNRICAIEPRRVFYVTDTEAGSSGSPVFNRLGEMIALHRAGGTPQKFMGLQPMKRNEGIRMDVIAPAILGP